MNVLVTLLRDVDKKQLEQTPESVIRLCHDAGDELDRLLKIEKEYDYLLQFIRKGE